MTHFSLCGRRERFAFVVPEGVLATSWGAASTLVATLCPQDNRWTNLAVSTGATVTAKRSQLARPTPDVTGEAPPTEKPHAYEWISALIAVGIVVQFLLAGVGAFGAAGYESHATLGWSVHTLSMVEFVVALIAPRTKRAIGNSAALLAGLTLQVSLPGMRNDSPWLAAFHPVLALAMLVLAARIGARGVRSWRSATGRVTADVGTGWTAS